MSRTFSKEEILDLCNSVVKDVVGEPDTANRARARLRRVGYLNTSFLRESMRISCEKVYLEIRNISQKYSMEINRNVTRRVARAMSIPNSKYSGNTDDLMMHRLRNILKESEAVSKCTTDVALHEYITLTKQQETSTVDLLKEVENEIKSVEKAIADQTQVAKERMADIIRKAQQAIENNADLANVSETYKKQAEDLNKAIVAAAKFIDNGLEMSGQPDQQSKD